MPHSQKKYAQIPIAQYDSLVRGEMVNPLALSVNYVLTLGAANLDPWESIWPGRQFLFGQPRPFIDHALLCT